MPGTACIACRRQERSLQDGSSMTRVIQVIQRSLRRTIVTQKKNIMEKDRYVVYEKNMLCIFSTQM